MYAAIHKHMSNKTMNQICKSETMFGIIITSPTVPRCITCMCSDVEVLFMQSLCQQGILFNANYVHSTKSSSTDNTPHIDTISTLLDFMVELQRLQMIMNPVLWRHSETMP